MVARLSPCAKAFIAPILLIAPLLISVAAGSPAPSVAIVITTNFQKVKSYTQTLFVQYYPP